jgi:hypothetical protein
MPAVSKHLKVLEASRHPSLSAGAWSFNPGRPGIVVT